MRLCDFLKKTYQYCKVTLYQTHLKKNILILQGHFASNTPEKAHINTARFFSGVFDTN
jgi:hypothetical protein